MFAWLAALCFFLKLLGVTLGNVDLVVLGFLFIALHLAIGYVGPTLPWTRRTTP